MYMFDCKAIKKFKPKRRENIQVKNFISLDFLPNCIHNVYVRIIGKLKLQGFWRKHRQARKPLEKWVQVVEQSQWDNWSNVKSTFGSADLVKMKTGNFVVFNIGGNKYRLITTVNFKGQIVIVDVVLTHPEYDRGKWKG